MPQADYEDPNWNGSGVIIAATTKKAKIHSINLNNVSEKKYSLKIYIQEKKMCAARVKGSHRGCISLLSEAKIVGVEMFSLYKKAPVDLMFVIMQGKVSGSSQTQGFLSEDSKSSAEMCLPADCHA